MADDSILFMMNIKAISKLVVAGVLGVILVGCKSLVNYIAFHPDNVNVIPTNKIPNGIQEITTNTKDGVEITSLYLHSPKSDKVVLYFHGNAGNIYHRIPTLLQLHQLGVSVIGVSYRGYGKSEGSPSEEGVYLDGEALFQYAVNSLGYKEEDILLFGRSIGTAVAIHIAQNRKLRGVILVTPLTSGKEQAKAGGLGFVSSLAGDAFDNVGKIIHMKSPLLVIHGTNDRVIPYSMGKSIFDKASVEKTFVTIEGAGHNNLQNGFAGQYWLPIVRFIQGV